MGENICFLDKLNLLRLLIKKEHIMCSLLLLAEEVRSQTVMESPPQG